MTQKKIKKTKFYFKNKLLPYVINLLRWENPNIKLYYDTSPKDFLQQTFLEEEKVIIFSSYDNYLKYGEYADKKLLICPKANKKLKFPEITLKHILFKLQKLYGNIISNPPKISNSTNNDLEVFQSYIQALLGEETYLSKKKEKKNFPPITYFYTSAEKISQQKEISISDYMWLKFIKTGNPHYSTFYHLIKKNIFK